MDFDVIIAGAGPAGLSVADDLSQHFKVLVLDKRKIPLTTCAWYSYSDRIKNNKLEKAVVNKCIGLYYEALDINHLMKDDCVVLNSNKALKIFYDRAKKNGAKFLLEELKDYKYSKEGIIVKTNKSEHSAKLLIDTTGIKSPILKKNKLVTHINSWVIYGATINAKIKYPNRIDFVPINDKKNSYLGIYPYSKTKADVYSFFNLEDEEGNVLDVKPVFENAIKKIFPKAKTSKLLGGKIISGETKKSALDRIIFFGESGMLTPPGCGMGFNEVLKCHKKFSEQIKNTIHKNQLNEKSLSSINDSLKNKAIYDFQQIIAKFSYYYSFEKSKYRGGVQWLNALGKDSKYWMRNEFDIEWIEKATLQLYKIFPLIDIIRVMPKKDYVYIIKHFAKFIGEAIYEESEKAIREYKKGLTHPKLFKEI